MNRKPEDIFHTLKAVRLTPEEKGGIRAALVSRMVQRKAPGFFSRFRSVYLGYFAVRPFSLSMALVLLFVCLTSWAAASSLPGDLLYPVKVNVNENVRGLLAVTPQAKAKFEAQMAARRLEEAEQLSVQGKLDGQKRQTVEESFRAHAQKVQQKLEEMQDDEDYEKAADAASGFESKLRAHNLILAQLSTATSTSETGALLQAVQKEGSKATSARSKAEKEVSSVPNDKMQPAAEQKMRETYDAVNSAKDFIDKNSSKLDAAVAKIANAKIQQATSLYNQGRTKYNDGKYSESFSLFQQAQGTAQEAKVYAKTQKNIKAKQSGVGEVKGLEIQGLPIDFQNQDSQPVQGKQDSGRENSQESKVQKEQTRDSHDYKEDENRKVSD